MHRVRRGRIYSGHPRLIQGGRKERNPDFYRGSVARLQQRARAFHVPGGRVFLHDHFTRTGEARFRDAGRTHDDDAADAGALLRFQRIPDCGGVKAAAGETIERGDATFADALERKLHLRAAIGRGDAVHAKAVADASNRVIEFARAQPALRTAGDGSIADRLVEDALQRQHRAYRGMLVSGGAGIATFAGIVQLSLTLVLVVGAFLAVGGSADIPTVIALLVLGVRFNEPIVAAGDLGGGVSVARTTLDQLDALAAVEALPEPDRPAAPVDWGIGFDRVTFGYGGAPVLSDLSFTAPPGRMTAIVGPSGSGKTTITKLMARFYDPEAGTVSIGGVPIPELGTAVVEAAVAPVFQDVYLFDDTILNNVWIGNPELSREEVIAAASRARVDEIAARLPGGWDARVGEGGSNLSGGERQRISIARALLKDAPIVLLDEATSALDVENEANIVAAVEQLRERATILIIAHRLDTIAAADQIVALTADGRIEAQGTHEQLLAAGGTYAGFWERLHQAQGWQLATSDTRGDQ